MAATVPEYKMGQWNFHPVVQTWFDQHYSAATSCQEQAWPAVQQKHDVLVSAPTGSGKTLAAFLAVIDELVQAGLRQNGLPDATFVVYVSPLKALSYDIERNLVEPLNGIRQQLINSGYRDVQITTGVRTGDTSQSERQKMARKPPHILVTTPESFYLLLNSDSGRRIMQSATRLIVDEIHALAGNKRGAHFSLSMVRFERLIQQAPVKIGLSATQKPLETIASYLTGRQQSNCTIVDTGHVREWDMDVKIPALPLEAVISMQAWADIYQQIADLILQHRTTLIFVNTRRHVERATRYLAEMLGEETPIGSHHGSLSKNHRHKVEQELKSGSLRALVATASLELGIDVGDVDLVCQIGSPRSIAVFLQRVGRSGHAINRTPKGRVFPTTRDELIESIALLKSARSGELEALEVASGAMDVLAQQIVAETCVNDCDIDDLYRLFKSAFPYRDLSEQVYNALLRMLSEGFTFRRGRRNAYIHLDAVNRKIRSRRGARITVATNAGVIPDLFDYDVIMEPGEVRIGTVNEDFAFESLVGDIFQLGNSSYRVLKVEKGIVRVEDAEGLPPNIPFWIGEGRGRSDVLSIAVSNLRTRVQNLLDDASAKACDQFQRDYQVNESIAHQVITYLDAARKALGLLPTRQNIVFERFFDEAGDMHLVVHSVYGSRLNKAWGLALRKRFCVRFNFELQAAALEDNFILSLGPTHSFALEEVQNYVKSTSSQAVLSQAVLGAPMFATRWRWVANNALAVLKFNRGKKVPPPLQRNDSEDLLSMVFPDQVACQENLTGPIQIPDHPLVQQTLMDCLQEVMDVRGFSHLLARIESNDVAIVCRDLSEPSALTHEVLTAKPYAFLDDAPAEERRTLAVQTRRITGAADIAEFGRFDADIVQAVIKEFWPHPRDEEEFHDAMVNSGFFCYGDPLSIVGEYSEVFRPDPDENRWQTYFDRLKSVRRATTLNLPNGVYLWVAAERLDELLLLHPDAIYHPKIQPATFAQTPTSDPAKALISIIGSRLATVGPRTLAQLAASIDLPPPTVEAALVSLESEGRVMRGNFTERTSATQWCDRNVLARLHKRAVAKLRTQIKPVDAKQYTNFLARWMRLTRDTNGEGVEALSSIIQSLEGFEAPSGIWESDILPARLFEYKPEVLDYLNATGRFVWCRLSVPEGILGKRSPKRIYRQRTSIRMIPLTFLKRSRLPVWKSLVDRRSRVEPQLSGKTRLLLEAFTDLGPLFFEEIQEELGLLPVHVEESLVELYALGIATCDHYGGIRSLLAPESQRRRRSRSGRLYSHAVQSSGRWSLLAHPRRTVSNELVEDDLIESAAKALLNRYGIVFPNLLVREGKFIPNWRQLRRFYARLEDRGELRGGRFVDGVAGEQFALPHAIEMLRSVRSAEMSTDSITVHYSDPFNLSCMIATGQAISAQSNDRLVYCNGELLKVLANNRSAKMQSSQKRYQFL